jgi:hypothetical protein
LVSGSKASCVIPKSGVRRRSPAAIFHRPVIRGDHGRELGVSIKDHKAMAEKFVLTGEPARLRVAEVIELLARQKAASEANACGESPVFEQGAVGLDIADESRQYRHSLDVRVLAAERQWSSLIAHSVRSRALVICNDKGRPEPHLGIEHGFLIVAAVAQWLAGSGADVELDGVQVVKAQPSSAPAPESQKLKKKVLIRLYESMWPNIAADIQEACRNGLAEAGEGLPHGYYDVQKALRWASRHDRLIGEYRLQPTPPTGLPDQADDRQSTSLNDLPRHHDRLWAESDDPDAYYNTL